jgi:hypothetical protein
MMGLFTDKEGDDELAADWAAIREKHTVETPDPDPAPEPDPTPDPAVAAAPDPKPAPEKPVTGKDRVRDDTGKFVAQSKEKKADPKVTAPQPAETPAEAPPDSARAPSSWKPTARAEWDKLSPLVKAEIVRREQDAFRGLEQMRPDAQLGQQIRAAAEPYRMLIEAEGGTPERAFAGLLRTAALFRVGTPQQKLQAIAGIAQQFGVDLTVFGRPGQQPQQQQPQDFRDPRVDQMLQQQQRDAQQREQREQQEMESIVSRWMGEVDEKGEPKRPYLQDVISEMAVMIPELRRADPALTHAAALEQAYERAVWAHPETRTLLQAKAASDLEATRRAANQTRTADARRAASVNVPRRASLPAPGKPGKLEDTIAEEGRRLGLVS